MYQNLGVSKDTETHTHTQTHNANQQPSQLIDGILELAHMGWSPIEVERVYNSAARLATGQTTGVGSNTNNNIRHS